MMGTQFFFIIPGVAKRIETDLATMLKLMFMDLVKSNWKGMGLA